jgi:hypothetical protein
MDFEAFLAVASDLADPGTLEDGNIKTRRFLGLAVEPQAGVIFCEAAILSSLFRLRRRPMARNRLKHTHAVAFGVKERDVLADAGYLHGLAQDLATGLSHLSHRG